MEWKTLLYDAIPAFIGGGLTLLGVIVTLLVQDYYNRKRQQEIIQGVLQALYEELIVLWGILDEAVKIYLIESEQRKRDFFDAKITIPRNESAAKELKKRTLTNLYNSSPQWLLNAHADIDAAVADAYGWPNDISDEEVLGKLLRLNLLRAS